MNPGLMKKRVELQSYTAAKNDYGEDIQTWSTYVIVWAKIEPLRGRELLHAQQISSESTTKIIIRYNASVTIKNRIKYKLRFYDVNAVINLNEEKKYMELLCKEAA